MSASDVPHEDHAQPWRLVVQHPQLVLIWANVAGATGCFGLALLWLIYGQWYAYMQAWLAILAVGGFLSLVAFVGSYLERRP
mgnify:FL=1